MKYVEMDKAALLSEKEDLLKRIEGFRAMNLALDMTRGKPSPAQLDLSNNLFEGIATSDFKSSNGTDVRNYGVANGIVEARQFFGDLLKTSKDNIYIGNGYFIHASSAGHRVVVSNLTGGYYVRAFSWGRRVLG